MKVKVSKAVPLLVMQMLRGEEYCFYSFLTLAQDEGEWNMKRRTIPKKLQILQIEGLNNPVLWNFLYYPLYS
jgi:hypothetical protein